MPLTSGARLGPYEILSPLGAGGMGEVYKARDTRLERTVAVKIMPDVLAADPQFRERFEREARTISQLDDPNICALYDVGEHEGTSYLVMQYLEGETLAARLQNGPLPLSEALKIAIQIAAALDRAHRASVVHRDLKPGNVMLTRSGAKLLDFGLAKGNAIVRSGLSTLPTSPGAITAQGTILGTFQYMAPEQVEGQEADARTDIFAFGAVLFEMISGRPAFQGKSHASLIGAILRDDPVSTVEATPVMPAALARVIRTCLAKNPDDRFQTAHDLSLQLQWLLDAGPQSGVAVTPAASAAIPRPRMAWLPWSVAAVATLAATAFAAIYLARPVEQAQLVRFDVNNPESVVNVGAPRISPDGRFLAFNATDAAGGTRIWVRQLNDLIARPLTGTEGTARPFWSPDSRFLGFMADGKLKKIEVSGGPAQKICDAPSGADGSWSPEGVILYDGRGSDPIYRVSAAGGTPVVAAKADSSRGETLVGWPEFLPDGRHFLFLAINAKPDASSYRVGTLDSNDSQPFASAQSQIAYASSGHLLFLRDQTLVAQAFDAKAMKTTGDPVPIVERVASDSIGLAAFSVSRNGTLAYRTGTQGNRLTWVDRTGRDIDTFGDPGTYGNPALSRDGSRLAFDLVDSRSPRSDIWIRDLTRGVSSRFTFGQADSFSPLWSPDGNTVVYSAARPGSGDLYARASNGQGEETLLLQDDRLKIATDWSRDGRYILFQRLDPEAGFDVWALPMFGDRKPRPVIATHFLDSSGAFSPDGRFVVYRSDESGRGEIYVQTFPNAVGKWQVSNEGGSDPSWRSDGKEILYRAPDQKLMSVEVKPGEATLQAGLPRPLFTARVQVSGQARNRFAQTGDGQKFIVAAPLGRDALQPTTVVLNWNAGLNK